MQVLTGRLGLRNELLSTFSVGQDVWEERYFVLTKKGLHYYVRQRDTADRDRRDLFGEHEGSIALGNIARVEPSTTPDLTLTIVGKGGGRRLSLRAGTEELYQRWLGTLQAAIDPSSAFNGGAGTGRSGSGTYSRMRSSSSFPRIPTLLDFRAPPRTDNLAYMTLYSSALGLEVLLESGLPWGVETTVERSRHRVTCELAADGASSSSDVLMLLLEGGATASIPLRRTLLRKARGTALVALQSPTMHKAVKLTWEAERHESERLKGDVVQFAAEGGNGVNGNGGGGFSGARGAGGSSSGGCAGGVKGWAGTSARSHTPLFSATSLLSLLTSTSLLSCIAIIVALTADSTPPRSASIPIPEHSSPELSGPATAAAAAAASADQHGAMALLHAVVTGTAPALSGATRLLLLAAGTVLLLLELWPSLFSSSAGQSHKASHAANHAANTSAGGKAALTSSWRLLATSWVRRLPPMWLKRLPKPVSRALAASEQPTAWRIALEPATIDRDSPLYPHTQHQQHSSSGAAASPGHAGHMAHVQPPPSPSSPRAPSQPLGASSPSASSAGGSLPATPARLSVAGSTDGELQMDALLADVASAEHSILYHAAAALRAAKQAMSAQGGGLLGRTTGGSRDGPSTPPPPADGRARAATWDGSAPPPLVAGGVGIGALGAGSGGDGVDLELESLLKAFELAVVSVLSALGPAMLILVKNDQANLRKVRDAANAAAKSPSSAPGVASSVRALLEDELRRSMHAPGVVVPPESAASPAAARTTGVSFAELDDGRGGGGGGYGDSGEGVHVIAPGSTGGAVLYDPSAAISLLWLRRSLNFTLLILENLQQARQAIEDEEALLGMQDLDGDDDDERHSMPDPTVGCVTRAYDRVMRPFHSWLLRKTFDIVSTQIPTLPDVVACLGPGLGEHDSESKVFTEIGLFLEEGRPVARALDALFTELQLEDLRQV